MDTTRLQRYPSALLRWLLPLRCLLCGGAGAHGVDLCVDCSIELPRNQSCCARCALPLAAPVVATSALFAVLLAWDEFFYALLFTSDQRAKTLTVAIADLAGGRVSDYGLIATAGVLAALPPVLIGLVMQRALISGLTSGGVKG